MSRESALLSGPDVYDAEWNAYFPPYEDDERERICGRCHGTGLVTLKGQYYGGDADDQPCPECSHD